MASKKFSIKHAKVKKEDKLSELKYSGLPVDLDKIIKEDRKKYRQDLKKYEEDVQDEEKRIETMKCPVCQSVEKEHIMKHKNNGIIGPGYRSYVTSDYYLCKGCGVHYSDINRKELKKPKSPFFDE